MSKCVEERSSLDRTVIANWYTPRFVLHKRETDALSQIPVAGPLSSLTRGPQQKRKGKQPMRLATTTAPTVSTTSSAPHAAQRVLRLSSPARKDPPEVWARYLCRYPHMRIAGVRRRNTDVSLRCLRGRHLVVIHEPSVEHSQMTLMRNKWAMLSAELFATPRLYLSTLGATGTIVSTTVEPAPYNGTLDNTTIDEVAKFYASRGITVAVANDTALYAALWLKTFSTQDSETNIAISEARQRVAVVLNESEIPVGINDNYKTPDGMLQRASSTTYGAGFFESLSDPDRSVAAINTLNYGEPSGSSSNTTLDVVGPADPNKTEDSMVDDPMEAVSY